MRKTILAAVQSALSELGQSRPLVVVSSSNNEHQQMFSLLIALCDELAQLRNWQELLTAYTFTTVPGQATYKMPTDYLRLVNRTLYDKATQMPVYGPMTDAAWSASKNSIGGSPVNQQYRLQGGSLVLQSVPTTAKQLTFDYISAKYVINAGDGVLKTEFTNDADGHVFDDRLVINGLKLKYLETKGFDTTAALSDFNRSLEAVSSSNLSSRPVSLNQYSGFPLIGVHNLPNTI